MAKATAVPKVDFAVGCRASASWAGSHAMDISSAGVPGPDACFGFHRFGCPSVMLLDSQISHLMAGLPQGTQQLRFGVQERLTPLGVSGSHDEGSPLQ